MDSANIITIQRDPAEMPPHSAQTFRIWYRTTAPSTTQYQSGSWDSTGSGQCFPSAIATIAMDSTDMQVQYQLAPSYWGYWYLVEGSGQDQLIAPPATNVTISGTPSFTISGVPTVSVAGTLPVSMATSASIAGTLPVSLPGSYDFGLGLFLLVCGLSLAFVLSGGVSWLRA